MVDAFRALAVRAGRARAHRRRTGGHRARARRAARPRPPLRWPTGLRAAADRFDLVLYGDRPATADEARGAPRARRRPGGGPVSASAETAPVAAAGRWRRHRSTLLIVGRPGARRRWSCSSSVAGRPARSRSTLPTRLPTEPRPWPGCSTTRASTSRSSARPTRSTTPASDAGTTVLVTSTENLGPSTAERLLDRDRRGPARAHRAGPGRHRRARRRGRRRPRRATTRGRPSAWAPTSSPCWTVSRCAPTGAPSIPRRPAASTATTARWWRSPRDGVVLLGAVDVLRNGGILRGRQRRRGPAAARPARPAGLVRPRRRRPGRRRRRDALVAAARLAAARPVAGRAGAARRWCSGADAGSARWPPSRCPSWSGRSRPPGRRGRLYRHGRRPGPRGGHPAGGRTRRRGRPPPAPGGAGCESPDALVRDVARHVGRPVARDRPRCSTPHAPAPTTDHDLITLATALAELDREVRRP